MQFSWLAINSTPSFYAFTTIYGLASASFQCLIPTTVASLTKRLDMVGTRLGMAFAIFSFAALTGPPIGGALQAVDGGSFRGAQVWAGLSALVCAVLVLIARWFIVGWSWKKC